MEHLHSLLVVYERPGVVLLVIDVVVLDSDRSQGKLLAFGGVSASSSSSHCLLPLPSHTTLTHPSPPLPLHTQPHRRASSLVPTSIMVSRFLRPIFSWSQDASRVAPLALAASARGSLMAALGGVFQQQHPQQQHSLTPSHMHQQQRHRWAGTADFNGSEQAVSLCRGWGWRSGCEDRVGEEEEAGSHERPSLLRLTQTLHLNMHFRRLWSS